LLRFIGGEQPRAARFDGDDTAVLLVGPGFIYSQSLQREKEKNDDDFDVEHDFSSVWNKVSG